MQKKDTEEEYHMREYADIIRKGDEEKQHMRIPTGILSLDIAIGHPEGLPAANIVQLLGLPSSGKTTVAYMWLASAQRTGQLRDVTVRTKNEGTGRFIDFVCNAVIVDNEASYDPVYAESLGVDTKKVLVIESETVEKAFNLLISLVKQGIQFLIVDSVNASMPEKEFEKDFDDPIKMAATATIIDQLCKRLTLLARKYDALCILINQYRANMSQMARSDKKAGGGFSLAYFSKLIIEFAVVDNKEDYAEIEAKVSKNKTARAKRKTKIRIDYGVGVRRDLDIILLAIQYGIITVSGKQWLYYGDEKAQGLNKAAKVFPLEELEHKIRQINATQVVDEQIEVETEVESE